MKTFLKNLALFLLPLIALFAPSFIVLFASGEFTSLSTIEELSRGERTILVGQAYSDFRAEYQLHETSVRRPLVMTLGNSRVGEFRAAFFKDPNVFYNTTGATGALSDYRHFIEQLADKPPKIILANMNFSFFNPEEAKNLAVERPDPFGAPQPAVYDIVLEAFVRNGGWWKAYADYFAGKFTLADVFTPTKNTVTTIGLRARADSGGFTNDGSDYYGNIINYPLNQRETLAEIDALAASITNTSGDEYGSGISSDALAELRKFLSLCKEKNIVPIGFLPPISHAEYEALQQHPDASYAYAFKNLGPTLADVYKEYGFDFYDFSDILSFGSSDNEMVDRKHGGEKMYLRLFIRMAENSVSLNSFVNIPYLKKKLATATSTYYVFGLQ